MPDHEFYSLYVAAEARRGVAWRLADLRLKAGPAWSPARRSDSWPYRATGATPPTTRRQRRQAQGTTDRDSGAAPTRQAAEQKHNSSLFLQCASAGRPAQARPASRRSECKASTKALKSERQHRGRHPSQPSPAGVPSSCKTGSTATPRAAMGLGRDTRDRVPAGSVALSDFRTRSPAKPEEDNFGRADLKDPQGRTCTAAATAATPDPTKLWPRAPSSSGQGLTQAGLLRSEPAIEPRAACAPLLPG